ncbi:MAG: DUF2252 family protein [Myxococcales bacterium]|nr:DUF2252 family protein [Myxococcales bacterium]
MAPKRRTGLALALSAVACAPPEAEHARAQWLQQTLILDNQVFLDRDPEQAGGKLAKMGERLYPYFRGTAAQYARDAMQPGSPGYWPSAYESARTRDVALVGDPHPENIGTFARGDGRITVAFNDFDAATYGPYGFDLRRLALGFWLAGEQIRRDHAAAAAGAAGGTTEGTEGTDDTDDTEAPEEVEHPLQPAHRDAAARAVAAGYVAEITVIADEPQLGLEITDQGEHGVVLDELMEGALEDGQDQEKLLEYTTVEDGVRTMRYGDVVPPRTLTYGPHAQQLFEDTVIAVPEAERALVAELLERYPVTRATALDPGALRIKGISRRLGAGVSSYPARRYYVLVEGPTDAIDDDVLLELKQVFDAVPMPGLVRFPAQPFGTNGERVVTLQRALQGPGDDDPWLGWASAGADAYRVRWRTGYQRGVQVDRLAEELAAGDLEPEDFVVLAELAGRLLARSHGRAPMRDGAPAAAAIVAAIGGDSEGLVEEVVAFVEHYAPRVVADHRAYVELLHTHGPRLGYRRR